MWQAFLERTFPGRIRTQDHDIHLAERGDGDEGPSRHGALLDPIDEKEPTLRGADMRGDYSGTQLDWKNTMIKWFIDCITIGAVLNTVAFLALMGMLKFRSVGDIADSVQSVSVICLCTFWYANIREQETIPIIVAGYKIWPIASILSFTLVPVEKRIVFLSAVGLFWGIYMSLVAARQ